MTPTLEDFFAGSGYADVDASPLQLAICRAVEGRPLDGVLDEDTTERHFGVRELPTGLVPTIVTLICGVRGGKSWLAASAAIHAALTVNLDHLKSHEIARFVIVGPTVDAASATFKIVVGQLRDSPINSRFIDGEPTADMVVLRRLDGRRVEICVVAASRGGATVRNRWLIGAIIEEVAQIGQEASGAVVSVEEISVPPKPDSSRGAGFG